MRFLIGSKEEFFEFLDGISNKDKIGIFTHDDLDGIASALFIEELLGERKIKISSIEFSSYGKGTFSDALKICKDKKITKVFITDMGADLGDPEGFEELRNEIDTFLIDHHPIGLELKNKKNIIKSEGGDCVAFILYSFLKDKEKWLELVCATMISEMSFKKKENANFIMKNYDVIEYSFEGYLKSKPGRLTTLLTNALIYLRSNEKDIKIIFDKIRKSEFAEIEKWAREVQKDLDEILNNFERNAEFHEEENVYFYYLNTKFKLGSISANFLSQRNPDSTLIVIAENKLEPEYLSASARNQDGKRDMNALLKNATKELENAGGGGHPKASGGRILKKDLEKFKENILGDLRK